MSLEVPVARPVSPISSISPMSLPPPRHSGAPKVWPLVIGAALALAVFAAHHPALTAGVIGSSDRVILAHAQRDAWLMSNDPRQYLRRMLLPGGGQTRSHDAGASASPLTRWTYAIDARTAGSPQIQPFQVRLTNLILHALNTLLLFSLALRLGGRLGGSALLAGLFALHPIQVEAIVSLGRREVALGALFTLLMVGSYLRYARSGRAAWLLPVAAWYLAAVLASPLYVGAPLVLMMLDVWPLGRRGARCLIEKLPMLALMAACVVMPAGVLARPAAAATRELGAFDWFSLNVASVMGRLLWPAGLSPFYPVADAGGAVGAMTATAGLGALLVWALVRHQAVFVALAGAIVLVSPALWWAAPGGAIVGDAWLYPWLIVPLLCLAAAMSVARSARPAAVTSPIGQGGEPIARSSARGRIGALAAGGVVLTCGVLSYGQSLRWDNSRDLYQRALALHPHWAGGYIGLIEACIDENDLDGALRYARKAVDLAPTDPQVQFYLGTVLLLHRDHRAAEAVAPLRRALESNRDWVACLQNLGVALARTGQTAEAVRYLEKARDLSPNSPSIHVGLGHAYLQLERPASARREFQEALRFRSDWVINLGLAAAWAMNDNIDLARRHLAMAVEQEPAASARAATFDALRRLRDHPGFESLIDTSTPPPRGAEGIEWVPTPAARGMQG